MQKGYKREYKALKNKLRKQLCNGEADFERAATDYVLYMHGKPARCRCCTNLA